MTDDLRRRLVLEHGEGKVVLQVGESNRVFDSYDDAIAVAYRERAVDFDVVELTAEPRAVVLPACLALGA